MATTETRLHVGLPILGRLTAAAARAPVDAEERLRLHHYSIFVGLGVPTMLVFTAINVLRGSALIGALIAVSCLGLTAGWCAMLRWGRGRLVYRLNFLYFAAITVFAAQYGGPGGSYGLWAYSYPLIAFFLFGLREGLAWSLVMHAGVVGAMLWPGGYAYPLGYVLRFATSYAMVTGVTYGYEHLRSAYRQGMEAEQVALRAALEEVRTLRGLIPICAGCYQIRDDEGFWQRLESYVEQRSDARFSHGLCPDCARRLYPEFVTEAAADGAGTEGP